MNSTAAPAKTTAKNLKPGMVVTLPGGTTPHTVERVWWEDPQGTARRGSWNVSFTDGYQMRPSPNTKFRVVR